jgi:hypothetical protein
MFFNVGGFFKGTFGLQQKYFYNISNVVVDDGELRGDVEKIVCFFGNDLKNHVIKGNEFQIEKIQKGTDWLGNYGLSDLERITETEYNTFVDVINNLQTYWKSCENS